MGLTVPAHESRFQEDKACAINRVDKKNLIRHSDDLVFAYYWVHTLVTLGVQGNFSKS